MKLQEAISLPIEIGDTLLMGRFKNIETVVKSIEWDDKGQLVINGKKATTFRIKKTMDPNFREKVAKVQKIKNEYDI